MSYQGIISPQTFVYSGIVAVYNVFHSHRIHIFPTIKYTQYAIFSDFFVQRNIRVLNRLNYDSNICLHVSENEKKYLWTNIKRYVLGLLDETPNEIFIEEFDFESKSISLSRTKLKFNKKTISY